MTTVVTTVRAPAGAGLRPRYRGSIHTWAFIFAVPAGILLARFAPDGGARATLIVYALGVSAMLGVSAAYHRLAWSPSAHSVVSRLDHSAIFIAIAATYTPVTVTLLDGTARTVLIAVIWTGAALGVALQWLPMTPPRWAFTALYAIVGWAAVLVLPALWAAAGPLGFLLLLAGGLAYTAGAVVYGTQTPDPWPSVFGFHEVFHACVVLGAACHLAAIAVTVLPGR